MNKQKLAKELCQKDGKNWDELDDAGKHGYFHYADAVIRKKAKPPREAGGKKLGHTHATAPKVELGEAYALEQAERAKEAEEHKKAWDEAREESLSKPAPTLKPGQYICSKCNNTIHRETSKIGKRHLKYKVEDDTDSGTGQPDKPA